MTVASNNPQVPGTPLRLWPGVAAVAVQWLAWFALPAVAPAVGIYGMFVGLAAGLVVIVWWLFFSRAPWVERLGALVVMVGGVVATKPLVHESITNGFMGRMYPFYSVPVMCVALVAAVAATRHRSPGVRRVALAGAILLGCGAMTLARTGGITGDALADLHWRWTPTPEERLLAQAAQEPVAPLTAPPSAAAEVSPPPPAPNVGAATPGTPTAPVATAPASKAAEPAAQEPPAPAASPAGNASAEWPGFRGPGRDSVVHGVPIATDWSSSPPVELWRRPIGPGWSSFAVHGDVFYTQEQRGEEETVSSYSLATGEPVWRHRDAARFWESNGGAGPRGTPTLAHGRVYTLGATGIVNALDARTGAAVWSRNAATDTGAKMPGWGFTSSPLVVDDLVIVAASGRLAAYDAATGKVRWTAQSGGGSYSSPHLMTLAGVPQVLLQNGTGVTTVAPADGAVLWQHAWEGVPILQPARTPDGGVLITTGGMAGGTGTRRLTVAHESGGWAVKELWTSQGLKPYFNDLVVHEGHAFGFDGSILSSIGLEDGKRKWKGGRYGHGQLVLLPEQDLLLVLSEEGELALVSATPDQYKEMARFKAIEGKTWNHPVLVGDVVLVRNGEEMAAFRLPAARGVAQLAGSAPQ